MSTAKVPLLIVEPVELTLSTVIVEAISAELKAGGLVSGMFYVGGVTAVPDMLYLLWHHAGEVPVSALINRDTMASPETARTAMQDFLQKWNQRIG